jgi:galactose mutarotase-like enzyme
VITLHYGPWRARINPLGAELQSLCCDGDEWLWQPQAGVWHQTAPWLFPFVGRLKGGGFSHAGRAHALPLHGFASAATFEPVAQQSHAVTLRCSATPATQAQYPFDFRLALAYTLDSNGLAIELQVHNAGPEPMPFGIGAHPGFALAGPLHDWHLLFEQAEADSVWRLQPEPPPWGLRAAAPEPWLRDDPRRLPLHAALFDRDALILDPVRSSWVALVHTTRGERLRLHLGGAPQLGLWARPGAPYVCIEPWWGRDDAADAPSALLHKPQLQQLAPGVTFRRVLRLTRPALG